MKLSEVAKIVKGELRGFDAEIKKFKADSRECGNGDLFFALKGKKFDGHRFVMDVYERGAFAVVAREIKGGSHVVVEDVKASLLRIASWKVKNTFKIAITGSNGKTTTKEIIASLLKIHAKVCKTEGNMNTDVGVSLSILNGPENAKFCVLEIGAQFPGDIAKVAKVFKPDLSVITTIGSSHSAFMDVVREKSSISQWTKGAVIYDGNGKIGVLLGNRGRIFTKHVDDVKYEGLTTRLVVQKNELNLEGVWGKGQIKDLEMALSVMDEMGLRWSINDLKKLSLPKSRMNFEDVSGYILVDDTYNASPESLYNVAEVSSKLGETVWVLAPMEEVRLNEVSKELVKIFNEFHPKAVFTVKDGFYPFGSPYNLEKLLVTVKRGDVIVVKGSRVHRMEEILEELRGALRG